MDPPAPTVLVTGAASGIGRAVALAYLSHRAEVIASDLRAPQETVDAAGEAAAARALALAADVADAEQVHALIAQAIDRFGKIDVLVANAGTGFPDPVLEISQERWNKVLGVNLTGTFLCVQAVLPSMLDRGSGSVVVVSSIAGRRASVLNGAHYTCSKYGLIGLTRHLAIELGGSGVRINCVCPGPTGGTGLLSGQTSEEDRAAMQEKIPLGRLAEPEDVAAVIRFVAGPDARHMHGAIVDVNGGMY